MTPTTSNTQETSDQANKAQAPAFEQVFQQFNPPLCYFARRWVNDMAIAQDIVTDVFVKLWQKQNDFKSLYTMKAFLYISTRNACLNYVQQKQYQARVRETIRQQSSDVESAGLNEVIHAEVLQQAYALVNDLPAKCKEVMLLCYKKGLDCHEIARQMQLSVHTVRNQRSRGVYLVRNKFRYSGDVADVLS